MKKSFNAISFTATRNTVTADKYVPYALYVQNKAIVEELGGQVCKGNEGFVAQFPNASKAKAFVSKAVCSMSKKEYNAARKSAPVTAPAPKTKAPAKPKEKAGKDTYVTLTDDEGNTYRVPMSALGIAPKKNTATPKSPVKKAPATKKTTKAPKMPKSKACKVDFSKLAGKGRAANAKASALINKAGYANNTPEYMTAWAEWCKVR